MNTPSCFGTLSLRAHLDPAPAHNGVATSPSPFLSHSQGDDDIAAPKTLQKGMSSRCALSLLSLALVLGTGCSKDPSASEGIADLEKSLGKAAENPAIQIAIAAAKTNDLGMGVVALQEAKNAPGLTAEQLQTVEQTSQAIVQELLRRADAGDARAKADLQLIERSRSQ
jgi:hypothetical protein